MSDEPLTPEEIADTIELFRAAGRHTIPVTFAKWAELHVAQLPKGSVKIETDENGKVTVKRVDKTPLHFKRAKFLAGDRAEAAFRANAAKARRERA